MTSPRYLGRAVVALAGDPKRAERTGGVFKVADLRVAYGFRDIARSQPESFRMPEDCGE